MRLDQTQFSDVFLLCKSNPLVGKTLGYHCTAHMTPEQFQRMNEVEILDTFTGEPYTVEVFA